MNLIQNVKALKKHKQEYERKTSTRDKLNKARGKHEPNTI